MTSEPPSVENFVMKYGNSLGTNPNDLLRHSRFPSHEHKHPAALTPTTQSTIQSSQYNRDRPVEHSTNEYEHHPCKTIRKHLGLRNVHLEDERAHENHHQDSTKVTRMHEHSFSPNFPNHSNSPPSHTMPMNIPAPQPVNLRFPEDNSLLLHHQNVNLESSNKSSAPNNSKACSPLHNSRAELHPCLPVSCKSAPSNCVEPHCNKDQHGPNITPRAIGDLDTQHFPRHQTIPSPDLFPPRSNDVNWSTSEKSSGSRPATEEGNLDGFGAGNYAELIDLYAKRWRSMYVAVDEVCLSLMLNSKVPFIEDTLSEPVDDETEDDAKQKLIVKKKFVEAMDKLQENQYSTKRRGNLPKECTDYLKKWFSEHSDHPYPSDEEKLAMSRETNIGVTQISHWFINYRKRVWKPSLSPRNDDGSEVAIEMPSRKRPRTNQMNSTNSESQI